MNRTTTKLVVSLVCMAFLVGCTSKLTGNEGNLTFEYSADDDVRDFNKPIAVGARLELEVSPAGTGQGRAELQTVTTDAPGVLEVASFSGSKFILEGVGEGHTLVRVTARLRSGDVVSDSVNMMARVPEVLKMWHTCDRDALEGLYLVDSDVMIPFDMEMRNGQSVIGYGYHPVRVLPGGALTLDKTSSDQTAFHIRTSAFPQNVTLKSTIDSKELALRLVEERDIDGATLDESATGALVGVARQYRVLPTVGGRVVCQARTPLSAVSITPDVCEASAVGAPSQDGEGPLNEHGHVRVTGKRVGRCTFTVSYANGRAGVSTPFTVDINDYVTP
jgi:hypothetical protein